MSTLSVPISNSGSPSATGSPTSLSHRVTVASATVSPSCGIVTSTVTASSRPGHHEAATYLVSVNSRRPSWPPSRPDLLPVRGRVSEVEPVLQHGEQDDAQGNPADGAPAAGERHPADHRGGHGLQFEPAPRVG
jgi:hypothetical protein